MKLRIIIPRPANLMDAGTSASLARLMAVGTHAIVKEPMEVSLCKLFGVAWQTDWPLAALSLLGEKDSGEQSSAEKGSAEQHQADVGYWLRADPVHLVLQRDSFSLSDQVPLSLSPQHSQSLMTVLQQHFAQDGLQFHLSASGAWYLRLAVAPEISTCLPVTAAGRDINPYLPQGADATKWNQLLNEIQMLLHDHAVNQAREAAGELAVNSLWFSGGGFLPPELESAVDIVFADDVLLGGLARKAGVARADVPENAEALLSQMVSQMASGQQALLWLDACAQAETRWFAPLLAGLRTGKIRQLIMDFAVRDQILRVTVRPNDLWKFWRRSMPFESYFMMKS